MVTSAKFWDSTAERYARQPVADVAAYQAKLRLTQARLSPTDRVLDLGCGTGSLALELSPHVAEVHAVDVSSEMLRIGREKAAQAGVTNIQFHHGVLEQVAPSELGRFDMVCAYNILHLVEDVEGTLRTIAALLKPGGHFVSSTACLGEGWVPYRPLIALLQLLGKAPAHVQTLSVAQLCAAMQRAGFEDVQPHRVAKSRTHAFLLARRNA